MQGIIIIRIGKLTDTITYYNRDDVIHPWSHDINDATVFTEQDILPKHEDSNFFRYEYKRVTVEND